MQNDLENVIPFAMLGSIYILTSPVVGTAIWHFRVFTGARLIHFLVYALSFPTPVRTLSFMVGFAVNMSMAVQIIQAASF